MAVEEVNETAVGVLKHVGGGLGNETIKVTVERHGEVVSAQAALDGGFRVVIVINNQVTNAPNTVQIASGAGHNSTAGNNAALDSSNTLQQQSVGGQGEAENSGQGGTQTEPQVISQSGDGKGLVLAFNNQRNRAGRNQAGAHGQMGSSATQVASGGGYDSAAGTNAAIASSNTKQQHAVAGADEASAENSGQDADQTEEGAAQADAGA